LRRVVKQLGLLQIDSVNVLVRAHYLRVFSRLGPTSAPISMPTLSPRRWRLFEYWATRLAHPGRDQPLLRWRMARAERLEACGRG